MRVGQDRPREAFSVGPDKSFEQQFDVTTSDDPVTEGL